MRTVLGLLVVCVAGVASGQTTTTDPFQFRGFSDTSVSGGSGVLGMTIECTRTFGHSARMCSSSEFLDTVNFPVLAPETGWIRPDFKGFSSPNSVLDASGVVNDNTNSLLTCQGWRNPGTATGLTVDEKGRFTLSVCMDPQPVACCEPRPVPEPGAALMRGTGFAALGALACLRRG